MQQMETHGVWIWLRQYWDDPADAIRVHEGTLLPLWRFEAKAGRGRHVTALAWSPKYADLLAVGYGSYDAAVQGTGAVACFTLKNLSAPEFLMTTRSGAAPPAACHFYSHVKPEVLSSQAVVSMSPHPHATGEAPCA